MSNWLDDYVADLRGSESTDPTVAGDDVRIALRGILAIAVPEGEVLHTANRRLLGRTDVRIDVHMWCKPFPVLTPGNPANRNPDLQDYGFCWQLTRYVLTHTYVHLLHLYKVGSDTGAGAIPRSRLDTDTGLTDETFWGTEIVLPFTGVLDGEARPNPNFEQGWTELDFVLTNSLPE